MDLESQLRARSAPPGGGTRPTLYDLSRPEDEAALEALVAGDRALVVVDTLDEQLRELAATQKRDEAAILDGTQRWRYGRWVHYPWSRRLVHLLPPDEFHALRTDRNRHRITADEQAELRRRRIGVVGLSVGRAIAATLALEGVGGTIKLADFDTLSLSNLNRISARLEDIGGNKSVLAARQLAELDPYLEVESFERGLGDANLEPFLVGGGKLDLVIEECDDLYTKVRLREVARRYGIPVVMHTTEGGIVDIERFDREPERALFHGLLPDLDAAALRDLSTKEKVPFVLRILGAERISTRAKASLVEIGETLSTWPQLGSAVTLGGAVVTDVARRLLLGELSASGRFYVEPAEIVADGRALPPPAPPSRPLVGDAGAPRQPPRRPAAREFGADEARFVVEHALLAPSGGNAQPWRFHFAAGRLRCDLDLQRASTFLDVDRRAGILALGAAVENATLAAGALGFGAVVTPFPDGAEAACVADVAFARSDDPPSPLYECIARRVTNRRKAATPSPLDAGAAEALAAAAGSRGAQARIVTDRAAIDAVGALVGAADRLRLLSPRMHRELCAELRWTPAEAQATRDGIDLATLEATALDRAVLQILADPGVTAFLGSLGAGTALARPARELFAASSAALLLTVDGDGPECWFEGGRALERLWLTATSLDIAAQPQGVLPFLLTRLRRRPDTLTAAERDELGRIERAFEPLFGVTSAPSLVMLLRLTVGVERWTARALRRPVDEVLEIS
jgi:molybdopterin/thiamine biosynthesis adenylyltransferase/nitroreductase